MQPLLSILLFGRNDNYVPDYLYRIETTLNLLAHHVAALNEQGAVEVVFVDWGSDVSLADVVELTPEAARMTRFIEVDRESIAETGITQHIYVNCAVNVGIRRARGTYIMLSDTDCMFSQFGFGNLLRLLRGELPHDPAANATIFNIRRYQIPRALVTRQPSLERWLEIIPQIYPMLSIEMAGAKCIGGFAAAQLMHRDLWRESRGYDEGLREGWGAGDNDLTMRVNLKYPWSDPCIYGIEAFHMEHHPTIQSSERPKKANKIPFHGSIAVNDESWGLGDKMFPESRAIPASASRLKAKRQFSEQAYLPMGERVRTLGDVYQTLTTAGSLASEIYARTGPIFRDTGVTHNPDGSVNPLEADFVRVLTAVCAADQPLNAFLFGAISRAPIETVARCSPTAQIFCVNFWDTNVDARKFLPPDDLSVILDTSSYKGYGQIIGGDCSDAIQRIESQHGSQGIELAVVSVPEYQDSLERLLIDITDRLSDSGALMLYDPFGRFSPVQNGRESFFKIAQVLLGNLGVAVNPATQLQRYQRDGLKYMSICVPDTGGVALLRRL